jgi:hypothetical protein
VTARAYASFRTALARHGPHHEPQSSRT